MNIEIKPGKWRMRNGECAVVEFRTEANTTCKWVGYDPSDGCILTWSDCGLFRPMDKEESDLDLISPWTNKPVVNWAAMPAWAKWVARNINGDWTWFSDEPLPHETGFWLMRWLGSSGEIPKEFRPSFTGNWRDSLVERPGA